MIGYKGWKRHFMKEHRPDPLKLLARIQQEEKKEKNGKLKIYLGAAPGVGKTHTMLENAIQQHAQGLDVVIGIVESHGRQEIEALLKSCEFIPKQTLTYHGQMLEEFDLDATLKRNPALVLVDEMAHTNIPGLRHRKRWQDIKELLDRGIDVYTTLNVQHIESLNDVVSQITHTRVEETIPDSMLEMADTIELIDLPQKDLLKRLKEGKVYIPKQAQMASENFFRKGNLSALRELALRVTAERVSKEVLLYRQGLGIQHIWPTKEKLLVCVGPNVESSKLIRAGRRMSTALKAEWIAVFVNTVNITKAEYTSAIQNLKLAEQLGADTRILTGKISDEIIHFSREQNITKIILGKHKTRFWNQLFFRTTADEIIQNSSEIDIYMITEKQKAQKPIKTMIKNQKPSWPIYGLALVTVILATLINAVLFHYLHYENLILLYLLGVTLVALFGQAIPSLIASCLSIIAYDYFFIPPFYQITANTQVLFTFLVMALISQIISHLTYHLKRQAKIAYLAETRTAILHTLTRKLASTRGINKLLDTAVRSISDVFNGSVLALLAEEDQLVIRSAYRTEKRLTEKEMSVAQWVFDLGQPAGLGTDTLPFSDALYLPLLTAQKTIGVLRIHPNVPNQLYTPEQVHLLESCASQIALSIEVDRSQEKVKQSELKIATDRVRSALLHSVVHDLETPLRAAMGQASTLVEMSKNLSAQNIKKIGSNIHFEMEQLNRLMNNLLQITYLEVEEIILKKEPHLLKNFIISVIDRAIKPFAKEAIIYHIPADLKVPFDQTLMQELLINLIDNALKFTGTSSPIEISAIVENDCAIITVADRGPGIVLDEVNKLFEKFYRGRLITSERGLGLGLAICHHIIKAHGGEIWAENREGGGALFRFKLPMAE